MSLIVEVYVGNHRNEKHRKLVASGVLHNVSNLADVSNYVGIIEEEDNRDLGITGFKKGLNIKNHNRNQSVWPLVKKMVDEAVNG